MYLVNTRNINHLKRQYSHWMLAAKQLSEVENYASVIAWNGIGKDISSVIKKSLLRSVDNVIQTGNKAEYLINKNADYKEIWQAIQNLKDQYLKAEMTIHFFTDAINSRTNENIACLLRACDIMASRCMQNVLLQLGKPVPFCLTFVQKGVGASILKSGLRLWDGNISSCAVIKITQHNLLRTCALIHECGHQIAHILEWNEELASSFYDELKSFNRQIAEAFKLWSSEIAADIFAFCYCGFGAVSALYNVVAGTPDSMFQYNVFDCHPISYLRVLLGIEMARYFYGINVSGELEESLMTDYPIDKSGYPSIPVIRECTKILPKIVEIALIKKYKAFNDKNIISLINPENVSPVVLEKLPQTVEESFFTSSYWVNKECLRLLALTSYRIATQKENLEKEYKLQETWMRRLGMLVQMN